MGCGVLGEERGWGPGGSIEPWLGEEQLGGSCCTGEVQGGAGRAANLSGEERAAGRGRLTLAATGSAGDGEWGAAATGRSAETEGWQSHCRPNNTLSARWHGCVCVRCT